MSFRACAGCPDRPGCSTIHFANGTPDCVAVKLAAGPKDERPSPPPRDDTPVPLHEAAAIAVRHWRMFGARGFDASITLLERVLIREGHPPQ